MPLRGKKGQATITVNLKAGEEAIGHATAARAAAYYASAYYVDGGAAGAGGRWCVALPGAAEDFPGIALDQLEGLGVRPGQEWNAYRLQRVLEGAGRRAGPEGKVRTHTWTFDLPKSFSALAAFGEDGWLTETIGDAAQAAMEFIAQTAKYVRTRRDGVVRAEKGAGIHYSMVVERTARGALSDNAALELTGVPSLHYHAHILVHYGITKAGRLQAFDASDALLNGWRQLASATADLRVRIAAHERGYKLRMVEGGAEGELPSWEVVGIPRKAIDALSERHRAIRSAEARGLSGTSAEMQTKAAKEPVIGWSELCAHWRRIIEGCGGEDPRTAAHAPTPRGDGDGARELVGPDDGPPGGSWLDGDPIITGTLATAFGTTPRIRWHTLVANFLHRVPGDANIAAARKWAALLLPQLLAQGTLVALDDGTFTTRAIRDQEQRIADLWSVMTPPSPSVATTVQTHWAAKALQDRTGVTLDDDQEELLEAALRQQATIAVGVAGSGKTATVEAIKLAGAATGQRVHIVAVAKLRARESRLAADAFADASVASFVARATAGTLEHHYARGDLLVVDEASQLRDDDLEVILRESRRMGLRVVLLGDPNQQAAIGRGAMFAELVRRGRGVVELRTAHRFRDPLQAVALGKLREGDATSWVEYAADRGWLTAVVGSDQAARHLAEMYLEDRELLVLTLGSNERRDEINAHVVDGLLARGEVSPITTAVRADSRSRRTVAIHQGSRIRINRQLREAGEGRRAVLAKNGEVATVRRVRKRSDGDHVTLAFEDGREITVASSELVATHAYVMGGYKATGATAERVAVDWVDGQSRQAVYPALSRQRHSVQVVMPVDVPEEIALGTEAILERIQESVHKSTAVPASVSVEEATAKPVIAEVLRQTADPEHAEAYRSDLVEQAANGDVDLNTLGEAEFTRALNLGLDRQAERRRNAVKVRARTASRPPLSQLRFVGQEIPASSPPAPASGQPRSLGEDLRPGRQSTISDPAMAGRPEWTPEPSQQASLEKAHRAWTEVEGRASRTYQAALDMVTADSRIAEQDRPGRRTAVTASYRSDLAQRWRTIATLYGISGAPIPAVAVPSPAPAPGTVATSQPRGAKEMSL